MRRHSVCILCSGSTSVLLIVPFFFSAAYTWLPYVSTGRTIAAYSCRACENVAPQVEAVSLFSDSMFCRAFAWIFCTCGPQESFGSSHSPRRRIDGDGCVSWPCICMQACMSCLLRVREKWMSEYLSGANFAPCFLAQSSHIWCTRSSVWQFNSVESDHVRILVSSTNPPADTLRSCIRGIKVPINSRKSIGDSVEPCGIPVSTTICGLVYSPRIMCVVRSLRNN